jgi:2-methylcitrate dehydratase PrpD
VPKNGRLIREHCAELGRVDSADVARVIVRVSPAACALAVVARPSTREQAWNSIAYAVARCLSSGSVDSLEDEFEVSPEISRLLDVTSLEPEDLGPGAGLEVDCRDGVRRQTTIAVPSGHVKRPATDEQLVAKWDR